MDCNIERQVKAVEFDKIAALLAEKCVSTEAKAIAVGLMPKGDYEACAELLAQTGCAYDMAMKYGAPSFYGLCVHSELLRMAAAGSALSIKELLNISAALRVVRILHNYRASCADCGGQLDMLFSCTASYKEIEDRIESSVLNEESLADTASPELHSIRRKMRAAEEAARARMNNVITSSSTSKYLQEPVIMMRDGRFVVPVKVEHRANMPGLVHGVSASGATLFIEPAAVVEANNEVRILQAKEQAETERILRELSGMCGARADDIICSCDAAVKLEVIFAKAALGISMNGYIPLYGDDGVIDIHKARHPLIEGKVIVPVDIRLGEDFDALVITGPNTGGKTVVLKTVGLFCMMAACGMMIPAADGSRVSWFDRILADIGDEQSIEQSLSTFSAHTTNIVSILSQTDAKSLVLLDELGAGTDPAEGAALAISILETIVARGAKLIATTHYAEMKQYALTAERVVNGSCEFDVATLRPTYRLIIGVPGSSNAFAISKRLGLDESIIDRAVSVMDNRTLELDRVMKMLEAERQSAEKDRESAAAALALAQKESAEISEKNKKAQERFEKEQERQRTEQMRIIQHLRFESGKLLEEIDKLKKADKSRPDELAKRAKEQISAPLSKLEQVADPVRKPIFDDDYTLPRPLEIGDSVMVTDLGKTGKVFALADKNGIVTVDIGLGKIKIDQSHLRLAAPSKKKDKSDGSVSFTGVSSIDRPVNTSIMIRHLEVAEAMPMVEDFLDECVLNGLHTVTIIHGKGTGTLKRAVHELLKGHPNVASFRLGKYGEGEQGVTVVELK